MPLLPFIPSPVQRHLLYFQWPQLTSSFVTPAHPFKFSLFLLHAGHGVCGAAQAGVRTRQLRSLPVTSACDFSSEWAVKQRLPLLAVSLWSQSPASLSSECLRYDWDVSVSVWVCACGQWHLPASVTSVATLRTCQTRKQKTTHIDANEKLSHLPGKIDLQTHCELPISAPTARGSRMSSHTHTHTDAPHKHINSPSFSSHVAHCSLGFDSECHLFMFYSEVWSPWERRLKTNTPGTLGGNSRSRFSTNCRIRTPSSGYSEGSTRQQVSVIPSVSGSE